MQAAEQPATHVASGAPSGVGWMYLQPMPITQFRKTFPKYLYKQSIGLGIAQILLGCICIIFNAITLAIGTFHGLGFVGYGFWCGVLFIVTGAFGISAGVSKTKCKVVSYMVLCIISASFTIALLVCGLWAAVVIGVVYNFPGCHEHGDSLSDRFLYSTLCSIYTTVVVTEGGLAVCGLIAAILFIWGSVLFCKAKPCCCYSSDSVQQMAFTQNYAVGNGHQMIQSAQYPLPTMPYQTGAPPACHPGFTQTMWMQPQLMQGTVAAAAYDSNPPPNANPVFGGPSEPPPKY